MHVAEIPSAFVELPVDSNFYRTTTALSAYFSSLWKKVSLGTACPPNYIFETGG
jgi:hypothetical protein